MRALALVGPRASAKQVTLFRDPRAELTVLQSASCEDVRSAVDSARPDAILIFGGDGTVNRHLSQLAHSGIPVLAVPAGSGNDLARVAGTADLERASSAWQGFLAGTGPVQLSDLGVISSPALAEARYFSCCANIGMDADAARRTNFLPDWLKSRGGYFLGGLLALAAYQPKRMVLEANDRHFDQEAWFLSISNTPTFGGGLKIAPHASIKDGRLDVTLAGAREFSRLSLAIHFPKILNGRHVGLKGLEIFSTESLAIQTEVPQEIFADGEFISHTPCEIRAAPAALHLVTLAVL